MAEKGLVTEVGLEEFVRDPQQHDQKRIRITAPVYSFGGGLEAPEINQYSIILGRDKSRLLVKMTYNERSKGEKMRQLASVDALIRAAILDATPVTVEGMYVQERQSASDPTRNLIFRADKIDIFGYKVNFTEFYNLR